VSASQARRVAMIQDADGWRGPSRAMRAGGAFKEWQHFVVFGPRWFVLLNLCLESSGAGRVVTLLGGDTWAGDVVACAPPRLSPGRLDADFDTAGMRFRGGRYQIWQRGGEVRLEAELVPVSTPSLSHGIAFGRGAVVSWCLVPRLVASGWMEVGGRRTALDRRLAYHDHNWGTFAWGGDFSWDWGAVMPDDPTCPWTAIFARMNDRARHRTTATSLFLLKDGEHVRYFRDAEVAFATDGALREPAAHRVPSAATLLTPPCDHDVPRALHLEAARRDEVVRVHIEARSRGQVLVPTEQADVRRVVRLNEVLASARVDGRCDGHDVRLEGVGLLEVVRG
jgi:hypothetical protein